MSTPLDERRNLSTGLLLVRNMPENNSLKEACSITSRMTRRSGLCLGQTVLQPSRNHHT
jgi:hypothetical protein